MLQNWLYTFICSANTAGIVCSTRARSNLLSCWNKLQALRTTTYTSTHAREHEKQEIGVRNYTTSVCWHVTKKYFELCMSQNLLVCFGKGASKHSKLWWFSLIINDVCYFCALAAWNGQQISKQSKLISEPRFLITLWPSMKVACRARPTPTARLLTPRASKVLIPVSCGKFWAPIVQDDKNFCLPVCALNEWEYNYACN